MRSALFVTKLPTGTIDNVAPMICKDIRIIASCKLLTKEDALVALEIFSYSTAVILRIIFGH